MDATAVLFPTGATQADAVVVGVVAVGGRTAVLTDVTPFHPLDHTWPDQPADYGTLAGASVADCLTGAIGPDGRLLLGGDIPVRRGEAGWTWVVAHLLDRDQPPPAVGSTVALRVDAQRRAALSSAHTACHLAALALNRAAAALWRKDPPRRDSLGSPDLDGLAVARSTIAPGRSEDEYRIGKSIRKKGLDTEALLTGLPASADLVTRQLSAWIATGAQVAVETGPDRSVAGRRTWTCRLPEGAASYPCGGTHVASLSQLPATTRVEYQATDEGFLARTITA